MQTNLHDYIILIKNFLDKDFCNETINQLEKINWKDHLFYNFIKNKDYKRSGYQELEVSNDYVENKKIIMEKLHKAIFQYISNLNFPWFDSWAGYSDVRFNKYKKNKKMAKHCDHIFTLFDGTRRGIPILSCLGVLNENYSGGEFIILEKTIIPLKQGDLLIFPSNFLYPHKVTPVKKGTRYSFISWVY